MSSVEILFKKIINSDFNYLKLLICLFRKRQRLRGKFEQVTEFIILVSFRIYQACYKRLQIKQQANAFQETYIQWIAQILLYSST